MSTKKKTLYQVLAVPPDASDAEIQAGYEVLCARLERQKDQLPAEEFDYKARVIALAFDTLSTPAKRDAYDAKLAATAAVASGESGLSLVPLQADAEALALKAEAMALRAEAMTMRADAMSLRSGATPYGLGATASPRGEPFLAAPSGFSVRRIVMVLGTVVVIGMLFQLWSLKSVNRRAELEAAAAATASEKTRLQEYFQTHGVRPANIAEMELLEADRRRKEAAARVTRQAERDQDDAEKKRMRFEEDARRRADQVSESLRRTEDQAAERIRREDERKENQRQDAQRRAEDMERMRIERQKAEWRDTLRR